jgi:hypothetical protein
MSSSASGSTSSSSTGETSGSSSSGETSSSGGTESSSSESGSSSSSSGSSTSDPETSSSSSTGAFVCDIVEVVEDAAVGKEAPVDCGFVHLADPLGDWEDAHDCVIENFGNESAFTVVAELQGIDSEVFIGFAGMVGETYVASQFFSDSYDGITIYGTTPCDIGVVAGCTVAVGDLCLECVAAPAQVLVCEV